MTAEASLTGAVVSAEMMRDYRRATHNTQTGLTILHERFGNPINRKALHSQMVRDLGVFVEDSDSLQSAITLGTHISEYAHFLKIIANKEQCTALKEFHLMWSRARRLQPLEFDQSFEFFFDLKRRAIQDYSDFFHLERQKNFKPDDLSVKVAFGEIGQIIEGCIQPFARHILHLNYLSSPSDKHNDLSSIAALSLGDVITRLNFIPALSSLYTPSPWKITLSQWRNIAQHCAYEFVSTDGTVTCHYGRAPRAKSIFLQYDVIHDLCRCINDIYMFHKTADAILSLGVSDLSAKLAMKCLVTPCTVVSTITEVLHTNSLHVLSFDVNSTPWELLAIDPLDRDKVQLKKVLEAVALFTRLIPGCQILFVIKEKSSEKFHTGLLGLDPTTESTAISD